MDANEIGKGMATVVDRETGEVHVSVNTPDYPPEDYLINPVIPSAPSYHWQLPIVGNEILLKPTAEILAAEKTRRKDELAAEYKAALDQCYTPTQQLKFVALIATAGNNLERLTYVSQGLIWEDQGESVCLFPAQDQVDAATTIEEVHAVTLDTGVWLATDPNISVRTAGEING